MLLAFLLAVSVGDRVPVHWRSSDLRPLELLEGTSVNCILVEPSAWPRDFSPAAAKQRVDVLGVVKAEKMRWSRPGEQRI